MEIYDEGALIWTLGSKSGNDIEEQLFAAVSELGGEGSITVGGASLYGEKVTVRGCDYYIYISTRAER